MKKIVHIAFSDDKGGAAIAAYRLHRAMFEYGLDSKMVVFEKKRNDPEIVTIYKNKFEAILYKIKIYIFADNGFIKDQEKGYFYKYNIGSFLRHNEEINEADIIVLHWISRGLVSIKNIQNLLDDGKKVYWVMHDMYPFTGGCHHSHECEKYKDDCSLCPYKHVGLNRAINNLRIKSILKNYKNMHWIAPSKWLYKRALESKVINSSNLYCIPNVISNNFCYQDKIFSRRKLGLQEDKKYVLFGADGVLNNPYKGLDLFVNMLNALFDKYADIRNDIEILIFGSNENLELINRLPYTLHFMGVVHDEKVMNYIYNAADAFVSASLAENYPLTIQEASFCGTPVVAFDVGGIGDIIDSSSKGKLIHDFNVYDMADSVYEMLFHRPNGYVQIDSEGFRKKIIKEYTLLFDNE